ncbi:MAG TPA: carbohydrate ABC transporter permease [Clostridiaceae bacterium]
MKKIKKRNFSQDVMGVNNPFLRAFNYVLLILGVLIVFTPIYIIFIIAFKSNKEYMFSGNFQLPKSFLYLDNFVNVIVKGKLLLGFQNTMFLVVVSVTLSIILGTMVSYAIGRFEFRFKKTIITAFLLSTVIPSVTTQVATFSVIKGLHLYNTLAGPILLYIGADIIQIYIFLQFISKIPYELDESAMVDGASYFKIYTSIILPQMRPAIVTMAILKGLNIYNDMITPVLYMPKSSLRTVTTAIIAFSADQNSQWNVMAAGIFAVLVPTLILYIFAQKFIIAGLSDGSVKG